MYISFLCILMFFHLGMFTNDLLKPSYWYSKVSLLCSTFTSLVFCGTCTFYGDFLTENISSNFNAANVYTV